MPKQQKVTVQVAVTVPEGTSKTKVEKAVSTLLKSGDVPEGFKLGAPKVVVPQVDLETPNKVAMPVLNP